MTPLAEGRTCPPWCTRRHGVQTGEEDLVHTSPSLRAGGTLLRLCASTDAGGGTVDGPYVLLGPGSRRDDATEYTLHEAEALIGALTQLVDQGWGTAPVDTATDGLSRRGAP